MTFRKPGLLNLVLLAIVLFSSFSWAKESPKEIRPLSELSGIIVAPKEERKQALSAGDIVFVNFEKVLPIKKGDRLEIYQSNLVTVGEKTTPFFSRAGQIIILDTINERQYLSIIESSNREIAVGDRIYFPE